MEMPNLPMETFQTPEMISDYHSLHTIQVCELYDAHFFDNDDGSWDWPLYTEEQDTRLRRLILDEYFYREISMTPPGVWKRKFVNYMKQIMPGYIMMYKILDEVGNDPLVAAGVAREVSNTDNAYKGRSIYSDFPETMLSENSDYASNGTDTEDERVISRDISKTLKEDYARRLEELESGIANIDMRIIRKIEPYFSCLLTSYVNGF